MKKLKLFFALFAMLALGVGNAWGETVFSDDFANVGTGSNTSISSRTGWSEFTNCYAQYNTGLRLGSSKNTGTITKTAMTGISGTTTLTVTFYLAKYNSDSGKMDITISGGGTASTTQFTPAGNAGVTSTTSQATWEDKYKCTFTITDATSATTIKFATSSKRLILGPITIEDASSTDEPGSTEPVVSVTPGELNFGAYKLGINAPLVEKTLTITGKNLTSSVTLSVTSPFEIKDGKTTLTPTDGAINQDITLVYHPTVAGEHKGTLTLSSTDLAEDKIIALEGVAKELFNITWKNADGISKNSTVNDGDPIGELPTEENCPEGKVFVGWTEATSVNPDGSGITYVKETDIPTGDITYNAVYAKEGETKDVETPIVDFNGGGKNDLGAIEGITSYGLGSDYAASNAPYQVKLDGDGDYIQFENSSAYKITTIDIEVKMLGGATTSTLATQTSADGSTFTDFNSWEISGAKNDEKSTTVTLNEAHNYLRFYFTKGSNVGLGKLVIKAMVPTTQYSDYSLDCSVSEKPALIPSKEEIDFGAKYVGVENTEEFTINATNLKGDITLAVTGNYFDVTPKNILSSASFPQTVTVTYKPEVADSHTATLTVTSTEAEDKIISLKGSATEAKIYTKTDLANITKYDEVLIVGTNASGSFAMANDDATNSGPKAISVTVDDNTIATDITNIQWSVDNTDGKLIFAPKDAETWLYCNNSNNGLRIGSDAETKTFEIKDDYIFNTVQNRYIGIYNSQDWRSYTLTSGGEFPTNIKDQTFAFYIIKGEVPENVYTITYETNGGSTIAPSANQTNIPTTLPIPTKAGQNFAGWYTDNTLSTLAVAGAALTDDITLYAKWVDPYTVDVAWDMIDNDEIPTFAVYVKGIVEADPAPSIELTQYFNADYYIKDNGGTNALYVFRGKYLNGADFTSEDELKAGDQVVVYGKLVNYVSGEVSTYEITNSYIYEKTSETGKTVTSLSWSAATYKAQIGGTNTFPTLTKSHDLEIKYTSSNTGVATIDNNGEISLVAAGTTTITAAIEEDATYAASSASYELTVVEIVPTGIFQLYSGELTAGEYVIVDGKYDKALKAAIAENTRLAGADVIITEGAIVNPDASLVWEISASGSYWTIYNDYVTKYAASTGANNAAQLLANGTDDKALWTASGESTYEFVNKANTGNKNLRWNNSASYYACYSTSTGTALRLYKKIDVPTPTISHPSGTYVGTQNVTINCALATATIYYTTDGNLPTTSSASIAAGGSVSITASCTLKAMAVADTKESGVAEATYEIKDGNGVWVLVEDADALHAGDLIVLASNEHNVVAGKVEEGNKFMTSVEGAVFNAHKTIMTTLPANAMLLTLGGSTGAWTLANEDLYLNVSGQNNSLGTSATTWSITINENGAAIYATEGEAIKYNSSSPRFKVYSSTYSGNLPQIYKYTTEYYTRDLSNQDYGTICLDKGGVPVSGATFYEVAYKNTQTKRVLVDEVVRLKAGVPYVFLPNATQIKIALDGTTAGTASKVNGLQGTFVEIKDGNAGDANNVLEGNHMLYNNSILKCGGNCTLPAYRAYFLVDEISTTEKASAPGRQRVALGYQGENVATGLDNITESGVIAPAMQGTYDVLGRQLSEPTATGFYIVNGKKVFVVK